MEIGSTAGNPLFGEIADQLLEPSSLAHLPGISIPCTLNKGLPIGIQFVGPKFEEQRILDAALAYEQEIDFKRTF
jgi:aspartyl-tRNA(Asn)/glutamyl-tRNA(Gln) amidotransferase subunit A